MPTEDAVKLTIVVPCYNEDQVLIETTRRLTEVAENLKEQHVDTRILYVDDGSRDRTWPLICELSEKNVRVCGLKLAHNAGHQRALWAGMEQAAGMGDAIVSIDADLQDDVTVIPEMVEKHLQEGADIVFGIRNSRASDTFFKRHSAQFFYRMMQWLGGDVVYNHADYRLMSRRAVEALMHFPERNLFIRGMVKALGFKQTEVFYNRSERFAGESKYPLSRMLSFAWDGITSFSVRPLRLIMGLGLMCILIAVLVIIWALAVYIDGQTLPGWTSLLVSLWFVGGAILTALGIIGEYVGKIYSEVKRRPRYAIDQTVGIKGRFHFSPEEPLGKAPRS